MAAPGDCPLHPDPAATTANNWKRKPNMLKHARRTGKAAKPSDTTVLPDPLPNVALPTPSQRAAALRYLARTGNPDIAPILGLTEEVER